jgi:hypothetical protein
MAIVSFVLVGLGVGLIITGAVISVLDWNRRHQPKTREGVVTEPTSALEGLAKLADALKGHRLGMQLIIVGIAVLVVAGVFGGVAQL